MVLLDPSVWPVHIIGLNYALNSTSNRLRETVSSTLELDKKRKNVSDVHRVWIKDQLRCQGLSATCYREALATSLWRIPYLN